MSRVDDGVLNSENSMRANHSSRSLRASPVSLAAARGLDTFTKQHTGVFGEQQADRVYVEVLLPKQTGSCSAQVVVVGHDDSDLRGCRFYRRPRVRDADQRSGFEGTNLPENVG